MPFLSPSAWRERLAEHDRDVLDRVVRVDLDVALGAHGQVERAVLAERVEHVVEERHAGGRSSVVPVPSRSISTSDLRLLGDPLDAADPAHLIDLLLQHVRAACRNASFSSGVPIVTRRCSGMPTSRISTPRSRKACHAARRVGEPSEQHEVGVAGHDRRNPGRRSAATTRSRSAREQRPPSASVVVGVPQRRPRGGLGERPTGGRAAGPAAARRPPPAPRPGSPAGRRRTRTPCSSCGRRPACAGCSASSVIALGPVGELGVRLVDHHDARARPRSARAARPASSDCAGRVVRAGQERDVGRALARARAAAAVDVEREVGAARASAPTRCGCRRR